MRLSRRLREDLSAAVRSDKYWKSTPGFGNEIFVVALSRARQRTPWGRYARTTRVRRACVGQPLVDMVRKYRILLVHEEGHHWKARKVLTWKAFVLIMRRRDLLEWLLKEKKPDYINMARLRNAQRHMGSDPFGALLQQHQVQPRME